MRDVADVEHLGAVVLLAAERAGDLLAELGRLFPGGILGDRDGDAVALGVGFELDDVVTDVLGRLLGLLGRRIGAILGGALGHLDNLSFSRRRVGGGCFYVGIREGGTSVFARSPSRSRSRAMP